MILHVKKYFIFCALILVSSLGLSQTTTFTAYGAPHWFGTTNAFAEDTLNSILHFQYSCNCGVGPGNQWSTFNHRNVITNATISPMYYGPYGTRYISKDLLVHNNRVYVNDRDFLTARTAPSSSGEYFSFSRCCILIFALAVLCLQRKRSLPVSMMWQ